MGVNEAVSRHYPIVLSMIARVSAVVVALHSASCPAWAEKYRFQREMMGTRFTIVCHADQRDAAEVAIMAAFEMAERVNKCASDYLPESELSQLAGARVGEPVTLTPLLFELLEHSQVLAEKTGGAFDPSLGPLTRLWRETRASARLPEVAVFRDARFAAGWRHFTLDPTTRSVTLHREKMSFDLGAVAKGYAADLMLESLASAGFRQSMIAAGGDIRLGDPPPGREGWRVAVQTFDLARSDEVLVLSNAAVSTSGDLHQSVEIDGVKYSHILDPATGLGLTRRIAATVIASEAKISDPLATVACVLGLEADKLLKKLPGVREVKIRVVEDLQPGKRSDQ